MGDSVEPGNALAALRLALTYARPDETPCDCGAAQKKGVARLLHSPVCSKGNAERLFKEIFDRETGRTQG